MKYIMYTCNVYIVNHFYFPEAFLQVKKLMEKTYSGTEQLEVHVKWFLNELLVSLIMPLLSSKSVDEKLNQFFFKLATFWR
jgi:hypothetical protein